MQKTTYLEDLQIYANFVKLIVNRYCMYYKHKTNKSIFTQLFVFHLVHNITKEISYVTILHLEYYFLIVLMTDTETYRLSQYSQKYLH